MQSGGRKELQPKNLFVFANAAQFKLAERLEASVTTSRSLCKPRREQNLSIQPLAEFFDSNHFVNRGSNHGEVKPVRRAHVAVQHLADVQSDINIGKRQACRFTLQIASLQVGRRLNGGVEGAAASNLLIWLIEDIVASIASPINLRTWPPRGRSAAVKVSKTSFSM